MTFDGKHYSYILAATNSIFTFAWQQQIILEAIIRLDSGVAVSCLYTRLQNIPMRKTFFRKGFKLQFLLNFLLLCHNKKGILFKLSCSKMPRFLQFVKLIPINLGLNIKKRTFY